MKLNRTDPFWDRQSMKDINKNWDTIENNYNSVVEKVSDEAFNKVVDSARLNWKEPVETQNDLPSNANEGDTRMTRDSGKVYRYNGLEWIEIQQIDAGPVNEVDSRLTSQLAQTVAKEVESTGYGVLNTNTLYGDLRVASRATPNMTVNVYGGTVHMPDGKAYTRTSPTVLNVLEASNILRKDIVFINTDGELTYLDGTTTPPDGAFLLAEISVPANATRITGEDIIDRRIMKENNVQILNRLTTFKNTTNSDGAVNKLLEIALTWVDHDVFVYGNLNTLFNEETNLVNGKHEIDCSSFVMACLKGITFENSKYNNTRNYLGDNAFIHDERYESATDRRMLANDMAKYAYENGWLFRTEPDYSNIKVGDILFWHNSPQPHFWEAVGHVQIVSRIEQNGDIWCIHAASSSGAIVRETVYTPQQLINSKAFTAARFPLHDVAYTPEVINYNPKGIMQSDISDFGNIELLEELEERQFYTVFIRSVHNDRDGYPWLRSSDLKNIYSFTNRVIKRPDNWFKANFYIKDGTLVDSVKSRLRFFGSTPNSQAGGTVYEIYVVKGFVTELPVIAGGVIVDSSSNGNGQYIKFGNGTMICTHQTTPSIVPTTPDGTMFKSDVATWEFPHAFTEVHDITVNPIFSTRLGGPTNTPTNTEVKYGYLSTINSDQQSYVMLKAIGRWK